MDQLPKLARIDELLTNGRRECYQSPSQNQETMRELKRSRVSVSRNPAIGRLLDVEAARYASGRAGVATGDAARRSESSREKRQR